MHLIHELVQVKLSPGDHSADQNKSNPVDLSIDGNTDSLCDRHWTKEWEDNFLPIPWGKIKEETQVSEHMYTETSPLELAPLIMWLNVISQLVSMCTEYSKLLHERNKLNSHTLSKNRYNILELMVCLEMQEELYLHLGM